MGEVEEMNHRVVQNIHAPVYGHVAGGNITVVENTPQERPITYWDLSSHQLRQCLREEYSARRRSFLRYWINLPILGIVTICLGLLVWVWSMVPDGLVAGPMSRQNFSNLWFFILAGLFVLTMMLGFWLTRIRRVEANVAAHAQAEIDAIELVLRRREYANR